MADIKTTLTLDDVKKIKELANLVISDSELKDLQIELQSTFSYIQKIRLLNTANVKETSQVTGLNNVFREDVVTSSLTQEQALSQAKSTYNGYFKVKAIFDEE